MTEILKLTDGTIIPRPVLQAVNAIFDATLVQSERGKEYYFVLKAGLTEEIAKGVRNLINQFVPLEENFYSSQTHGDVYRVESMNDQMRSCEVVLLMATQLTQDAIDLAQKTVLIQQSVSSSAKQPLETQFQPIIHQEHVDIVKEAPPIIHQEQTPEEAEQAFYRGNKEEFLKVVSGYFKVVLVGTQEGEDMLFLAPKTKLLPIMSLEGQIAKAILDDSYYAIDGQPHPHYGTLYYTTRQECIPAFKKVLDDLKGYIENTDTVQEAPQAQMLTGRRLVVGGNMGAQSSVQLKTGLDRQNHR